MSVKNSFKKLLTNRNEECYDIKNEVFHSFKMRIKIWVLTTSESKKKFLGELIKETKMNNVKTTFAPVVVPAFAPVAVARECACVSVTVQ